MSPVLALKKGVASLMKSVPDSLNEVFSKAVVGEPLFGSPSKSVSWLLRRSVLCNLIKNIVMYSVDVVSLALAA
jgi:hypothetical protein